MTGHGLTTPSRARGRTAAVGLIAAVALTACSGDEQQEGPAEDLPLGAVDQFRAELAAAGGGWGDAIAQHSGMQEDISACMSALGFEYTPIDFEATTEVTTADDLGLVRGTREYAEQFGFGISTDDMGYYAMNAQTVDDPNSLYVAGLSEAARAQYDLAMWGTPIPVELAADPEMDVFLPWNERGCSGYAENRAFHTVEASEAVDPAALWAEEDLMRQSILADTRVMELHDDWADCMADAGHPGLAVPGDNIFTGDAFLTIQREFDARMIEIQTESPATDVTDPSTAASLAALEIKAELSERETAMAVADFDCRAESGYAQTLRAVQIEYQADFFEAHRAEYEAYASALAELRAADSD